jgi:catechol 2,3-dioxygenase-like lactoylglutathione lyase family enzyme
MYLDYAGLRVTRLAPAVRFVRDGLGLAEVRRGRMPDGAVWVLFRDPASHQQLELNWYPKGSRHATPFSAGEGLDHLGFRVQDLAKAGRRLTAAGARKVEEVREGSRVVLAFYEGPDGLWIELIHSPSP